MKTENTTALTHRPPRVARPRKYSPKIAAEICARLMEGESLVLICSDPVMPSRRMVFYWLANPEMEEFHKQYAFARQIQAEGRVDEMFALLDDDSEDYIIVKDKKGRDVVRPNHEHHSRLKIRVDAIKWFASKLAPRIYGEKMIQEHDITGDLAKLLTKVSNQNAGLPEPVSIQ